METDIAAEEAAVRFDLLLRAEALEAACPVRNAKPPTRPWAFRRWATADRFDVSQDAEAMAWVDATFDTGGAIGRLQRWAGMRRATLSGPALASFERAFCPADGSRTALAERLEWAQAALAGNAQFRKLDIGADFANPAAAMFVDRVNEVERARARIAEHVASYGMSEREAAESVERLYRVAGGPAFPSVALAA